MGFDIQHYYSLHQNLTLEDLAKASSRHTLKGLVKVINKVSLSATDIYLVTLNLPKDFTFEKLMHCWILISIPIYLLIFELLKGGHSITTWTRRGG